MKLILTFPAFNGARAEIGSAADEWTCDQAPIKTTLDEMNRELGRASHLPHPYLHVAEEAVRDLGAVLDTEGEGDLAAEGEVN